MTDAVFPAPAFPELIDNTMREAAFVCATKMWYGYERNLAPRVPSVHLHAGGAFARGLEVTRRAFYETKLDSRSAVGQGLHALLEFYGTFEPPYESNKTATRMAEALVSYFQQYPLETDFLQPFITPNGKPAIEFTFACEIPDVKHPTTGNPLLYGGRFDMLAMREGVLFVDDEKTTSQLGASWAAQWELNSQFTGYCWGAKQHGFPVAGAIIRGISILKNSFGHAQAITYRPAWAIDRWLEQLVRDAKRMVRAWEDHHERGIRHDMALGSACSMYGGCPYKLLCASPDPEKWIEANYTHRVWDPMHRGVGGS
jgi:hypothetical protein